MHKKIFKVCICTSLLLLVFCGCVEEESTGILIKGKGYFTSIQNAIDNASSGDTIYVYNGTYYEALIIDKSIKLIGEGNGKTIINYNKHVNTDQVNIILVNADNCKIKGLTILNTNESTNVNAINVLSSNNIIEENMISYAYRGIQLQKNTQNNTIFQNNLSFNAMGIYTYYSNNNDIFNNYIFLNPQYGIYIYNSDKNTISKNIVLNSTHGMRIKGSKNTQIFNNIINNNTKGLYFCCGARENTMHHNSFQQNIEWHVYDALNNNCDNGTIGNYYDDYIIKYPNASIINEIWNTPYNITGGNSKDNYPLVNPVTI